MSDLAGSDQGDVKRSAHLPAPTWARLIRLIQLDDLPGVVAHLSAGIPVGVGLGQRDVYLALAHCRQMDIIDHIWFMFPPQPSWLKEFTQVDHPRLDQLPAQDLLAVALANGSVKYTAVAIKRGAIPSLFDLPASWTNLSDDSNLLLYQMVTVPGMADEPGAHDRVLELLDYSGTRPGTEPLLRWLLERGPLPGYVVKCLIRQIMVGGSPEAAQILLLFHQYGLLTSSDEVAAYFGMGFHRWRTIGDDCYDVLLSSVERARIWRIRHRTRASLAVIMSSPRVRYLMAAL